MRVVGLISGGKDSSFNLMQCTAAGHEIVLLANLYPEACDELDSYMYQTVGHMGIQLYAEAMDLPLIRRPIKGASKDIGKDYIPTEGDEVEDLYLLLQQARDEYDVEGVSVGAILSNYQRVRVENVCSRLGLTALAYLWRQDQAELLTQMLESDLHAVIIKVASLGLEVKHLGKSLQELEKHLHDMNRKYGVSVCGEGGEYETFTLDCPLFRKKLVIDNVELITPSVDVGYLNLKLHLEDKCNVDTNLTLGDPLSYVKPHSYQDEEVIPDYRSVTKVKAACNSQPSVAFSAKDESVLWLSGIVGSVNSTAKSAMAHALLQLQDELIKHSFSLTDLVIVCIYVADMQTYAKLNKDYIESFGLNPPVRACVEVPLDECTPLMLEAVAWKDPSRTTMHVQSISHWAPANIGPYSQAIQVHNIMYIAGQIGLVPGSMTLIPGGVKSEASLALRHVDRIIRAKDESLCIDHVISGICFLKESLHIYIARAAWKAVGLSDEILTCVIVTDLPRSAAVEWQVIVHREASDFSTKTPKEDLPSSVIHHRRNINTEEAVNCCILAADCKTEKEAVALLEWVTQNMAVIPAVKLFYVSSLGYDVYSVTQQLARSCAVTCVPVKALEVGANLLLYYVTH